MSNRYSRQMLFSPIGEEGQKSIRSKHVLVVGTGALGTGNAENLVRAGIGTITIVDRDYVEFSNLQRQQLYTEKDAENRIPKAIAAKNRLKEVNSDVTIHAHVLDVTKEELEQLIDGVDLIVDGTDNFDTRLLINDIAQKYSIPWIYGACVSSYGLSYTIIPGETPCLNCLLETVPLGGATCDTVGVISPVVQMVVAYQTAEALKLLVGDKKALRQKLVSFDLWKNDQMAINVNGVKKKNCPSCGEEATYPYLSYDHETKSTVLCGRNTVQIRPPKKIERDMGHLYDVLSAQEGVVEQNPYLISYTLADKRMVFFKDGRVLVHGTNDIAEAKTLYHRILG
ncbi:thiazole biosynthesis adenylyltransferase ThiF [Evansella cellulosilytica]|uniref:UBA/THIF-type NAD/FAD binding protein n=1 Tax=Evansella cellulosilytica (strain ATCC 21833 / DSM 2522 / FERM P-1141 / JCM 9156 / N-4) TaxID=649639 RepID=E6U041_EVAC2|nr:thiazole biosynthesis adenylyltransferase ThiF [Evansella cellulosilytica]ADU29045.1 UBA/THIF-type NAD/FAD binding protein [Evansella cellulosilytica DSM 2522]